MTLNEFLLARIAEAEGEADQWPEDDARLAPNGNLYVDAMGHPIWASRTRVHAECEARRQIVNIYRVIDIETSNPLTETARAWRTATLAAMEDCIAILASVYSDHADYREEWAG